MKNLERWNNKIKIEKGMKPSVKCQWKKKKNGAFIFKSIDSLQKSPKLSQADSAPFSSIYPFIVRVVGRSLSRPYASHWSKQDYYYAYVTII